MAKLIRKKTDTNKPMDEKTIGLLNKVTKQINDNNQIVNAITNTAKNTYHSAYNPGLSYSQSINSINGIYHNNTIHSLPKVNQEPVEETEPSPYINMESDIYKNEFEVCWNVIIGDPLEKTHAKIVEGVYCPAPTKEVQIGLIDEVSEDEDDLYAKFPDGEIVPFNGHTEKIEIDIFTLNELHRSDLIGSEIKKVSRCNIIINDRLARIIDGVDVQDLLMKVDRAIDELKTQPFSICRDGAELIGRKIYYNNQPAIISSIDEPNNFIVIIPDPEYLTTFNPPAYAIEDDESDEWVATFGKSMIIRDYDEKIWWWRNADATSINPSNDPFYNQFPQPQPAPPTTTDPMKTMQPWPNVIPSVTPWAAQIPLIYTNTGGGTTPIEVTWAINGGTGYAGGAPSVAVYSSEAMDDGDNND